MWLILCDPHDDAALWAHSRLRRRGLYPLELITPRELVRATRSVHEIDVRGARFEIQLSDGRTFVSTDIRGTLNRLTCVPADSLGAANPADRDYAIAEMNALIASWLTCVSSVTLSKSTPSGLCGAWRPPLVWHQLAAEAGIPTAPQFISTREPQPAHTPTESTTILVLGEDIFGAPVSQDLARASVRLARLAEADVLGVGLQLNRHERLEFADATPLPDLRIGGDPFIEALYAKLTAIPAAAT